MNVLFYLIGEGETLLFILVLLYLTECVIWVKRESVAFVSSWGGNWHLSKPSSWLGNARGGILFLNPVPPSGRIFLSHLSPVSISPSGVCALNVQTLPTEARSPYQTGEFLPFEKIKDTGVEGAYLTINNERFAMCANGKQARTLAGVIVGIARAPASKREGMARAWIAKQFSTTDANSLLKEMREAIEPIQSLSLILFLVLFVLTPALGVVVGLMTLIVPVAIVMVGLAIVIAILFRRVHRKFFPEESSERLESLVKMTLCPPVALRAADILTKNLLAEFSPVVLANVLTGSGGKEFVRDVVLDLKHPLKHELTDNNAIEAVQWAAGEQLKFCERSVKTEELLAPIQREENSTWYCPRCRCQFVAAVLECPDCPGVGVLEFETRMNADKIRI